MRTRYKANDRLSTHSCLVVVLAAIVCYACGGCNNATIADEQPTPFAQVYAKLPNGLSWHVDLPAKTERAALERVVGQFVSQSITDGFEFRPNPTDEIITFILTFAPEEIAPRRKYVDSDGREVERTMTFNRAELFCRILIAPVPDHSPPANWIVAEFSMGQPDYWSSLTAQIIPPGKLPAECMGNAKKAIVHRIVEEADSVPMNRRKKQ